MADISLESESSYNTEDENTQKKATSVGKKINAKKRKQKYRAQWEINPDFKLWIGRNFINAFEAKCKICNKTITADISALKSHAATQKHKRNMDAVSKSEIDKLQRFAKAGTSIEADAVVRAELVFCGFLAEHNMSFNVMDHMVDMMKHGVPDSTILNKVKMKRTKATLVTKSIGRCHKDDLIERLKKTKYSLMIDESTDVGSQKHSCIVVRYFNEEKKQIDSSFFDMVNLFENDIEAATAEVIFNAVVGCIMSTGVPMENLIGFGSDGCNSMMGKNNSVQSRLSESYPGIYISKCICHSLHLCSSTASKVLPRRVEDLARDIYTFFKSSAKRKAIYSQFQDFLDLEPHKILAVSQTRWLSLHPVVNRILEQWAALKLFFVDMRFSENLLSVDRIVQTLDDPQVKLFFLFLDWVLPKINAMNAYFQSEKCIITNAFDSLCSLYKNLLSSFMKQSYISSTPLHEIDVMDENNLLTNDTLYIGTKVLSEIDSIYLRSITMTTQSKTRMINDFKNRCRSFLQTFCIELLKRFDFDDPVMKKIGILHPSAVLDKNVLEHSPSLYDLISKLPRCVGNIDTQKIDDEWRLISAYQIDNEIKAEKVVDTFWYKLRETKTDSGFYIFKNVATFALNAISLPHSNADCERIFSATNNIKTDIRNRISLDTLTNTLLAKECVAENSNCTKFEPSTKMKNEYRTNMYSGSGEHKKNDTDDYVTLIE